MHRFLVVFFSLTGNTKKVAQSLSHVLSSKGLTDMCEIKLRVQHGYLGWLLRSFIPGKRTGISDVITDLSPYSLVFLGTPKWTFACPPINEYVARLRCAEETKVAVFMTYGGFDEKRYLEAFQRNLRRLGICLVGALSIKRRRVEDQSYLHDLEVFVEAALLTLLP